MNLRAIAVLVTLMLSVVTGAYWMGVRQGKARQWQEATAPLRDTIRVTDSLYRADTVRLWRVRQRWDTVVAEVEMWKHDTVRVVEYVQLADSTVRACVAALRTCEQRVALERRLRQSAESALAAMDARPSPRSRAPAFAAGALAGVATALLLRR